MGSRPSQPAPTQAPINPSQFLSTYNPQHQSPLFSVLPAEIRNHIFDLVLLECDATPFSTEDFWYRPDYPASRAINVALLRTCRLVYLETWNVPLLNVTHRQWLGWDERRCPEHLDLSLRTRESCRVFGREFCPRHVQVFAQMFAAEGEEMKFCLEHLNSVLKPKVLTITFRYTDWWSWETDDPLRMENWPLGVQFPSSVETLVMEFETRNGKRNELDQILNNRILKWKTLLFFPHDDPNRLLTMTEAKARRYTWIGAEDIGSIVRGHGYRIPHHSKLANGTEDLDDGQMQYYVATVEWTDQQDEHGVDSLASENGGLTF